MDPNAVLKLNAGNSSVTDSIISSERAFLVAGLARVMVCTPSSFLTLVKEAILLL